ncbi:PD-(D/E)XK nuclease family transposase [Hungatella effluvii]|uniref:PD-(D/E)XK nuclease family transposase n=1 Tax=Hungatella effluvii TaxID=1096246 RepID=UPI002FDA9DF7
MQENTICNESKLDNYEEKRKKVSFFHLTSDIFFSKVMEDLQACQEVIQILTEQKLTVKKVKTQYSIRNMENRSVILDILAEDEAGRIVNVEMHPKEDEDHVRRVRYHLSSIDMSFLEKGTSYDTIPEVYLIYITERDFIGENRGINEVERIIKRSGKRIDNGVHELYVNFSGKIENAEQKELLSYMVNSDSNYKTDTFPNLVKRVKLFKEKKEGINIMCDIIDRERAEGRAEGKAEVIALIRRKYQKQNTPEQAAEALELEIEYVRKVMNMIASDDRQSNEAIALQLLQEIK